MGVAEVVVCVVPSVVLGLVCIAICWFSYHAQKRIASHAWRMLQANLVLSGQPLAANLAHKQEDTAQLEATPPAQNGMSERMKQRNFIHG